VTALLDDTIPSSSRMPSGTAVSGVLNRLSGLVSHPAIKNAGWIVTERIGRLGISLVVGILVVRKLGAERYGIYAFALTAASLYIPLATCGMGENIIRHLLTGAAAPGRVLGTAFTLRVAAVAASLALTFATFAMLPGKASATYLDVGTASLAMVALPLLVLDPFFQSSSRSRVITVCGLTAGVLAAVIKVFGVVIDAPVTLFLAAHAAESILLGAGLIAAYELTGNGIRRWRFDPVMARALVREAAPTILAAFAIMIYTQSDVLLLGLLTSEREVGIYSAGVRISMMWLFVPMAVLSSAAPFLYRAQDRGEARYLQQLQFTMSLIVALCYPFVIVLAVAPNFVAATLFGEAFRESGDVVRVYVWSNIFAMLGMAQSTWFIGRGLLWVGFRNTCVGAVLNLLMNLYAIPRFGPVGAAATTLAATLTTSILLNGADARTRVLSMTQLRALMLAGLKPWHSESRVSRERNEV
jgi:O-antigen/teichoic acid export membrane protein